MTEPETHFGFQRVAEADKSARVADVFDSVSKNYDVMNDLMSLGMHRLWKAFTIGRANVRPGQKVLDIAGGTGDLAAAFAQSAGPLGEVWLTDINQSMLSVGRDKHRAVSEMTRVLKPGGRLLVLEFSKVWKPLQPVYDAYSFRVLPWLGKKVAKDAESYQYLAESIRMHPDQETLKNMMAEAGLSQVKVFNLAMGVVALHEGAKL
jgi:demethylmenaquinone methyltransferase/2-methoxy-6-polyprenyl-1,4-benzoquinol methylase